MWVNFAKLLLLELNENAVFCLTITQNKVKGPFFLKSFFFILLALVVGCLCFLNKILDKI